VARSSDEFVKMASSMIRELVAENRVKSALRSGGRDPLSDGSVRERIVGRIEDDLAALRQRV